MENENNMMTVEQIDAELSTLPEAIAAAAQALQELETANDISAKGLNEHAKAASRLQMLKARKDALAASRPMAELTARKLEVDEAQKTHAQAEKDYKLAQAEMRAQLLPILGERCRVLEEAIEGSIKVEPLLLAARRAASLYQTKLSVAIRRAGELGLKYTTWA